MPTVKSTPKTLRAALWPKGIELKPRDVRCRHCGTGNEVEVPVAALEPERCACGSCGEPLFLTRAEPLTGLPAAAYQHTLDAKSLAALRSVPGFDRAVKWLMEQVVDRSMRLQLMSGALRCGEDQFPELVALLDRAQQRLGVDFAPTLYVSQQPFLNAMTSGVDERVVCVWTGLLDQLEDDELITVFGHELGHQHAQHQLYGAMADLLAMGGVNLFAPLRVLSLPIQLALLKWKRCAELTCDRAGLLASRDVGASVRVLLKLVAGGSGGISRRTTLDLGAFVKQARDLATMEGSSSMDGLFAALLTLRQSHPYPAWRLMHLLQWIEHGNYLEVISGGYAGAASKKGRAVA